MKIPDFLDLDTVTAADWRAATADERQAFLAEQARRGFASFRCLICSFPTPRGQFGCEACRPFDRQPLDARAHVGDGDSAQREAASSPVDEIAESLTLRAIHRRRKVDSGSQ